MGHGHETVEAVLCGVGDYDLDENGGFKISGEEFAFGMHQSTSDALAEFSRLYFGKEKHELGKEENHELDCFGAFGAAEWLADYHDGTLDPAYRHYKG